MISRKKKRFRVFISHASQDYALAEAMRKLLSKAVPSLQESIFVSSDSKSIRKHEKWDPAITQAHQQSGVVIALMTPASVFRPWVIYEAGGANFQSRKPLFVVRANGLGTDSLPGPLTQWQSTDLSHAEDVKILCQSIATLLREKIYWLSGISQAVKKVTDAAKMQAGDWSLVTTSLTSAVVHKSPFNFLNLLDGKSAFAAKKTVCVVGQNLHTLIVNPAFKQRIFDWLENRSYPQRRIALITCNPKQTEVVNAWQVLHDKKLFVEHLNAAARTFKLWQKEAQRKCRDGKLLFMPMDDFPLNLTFVDPEERSGFLVLTSVSTSGATGDRPHFIIGRNQHPKTFDYYWLPILQHIQRHQSWSL
jgi:hypothetical protein